MNILITGEVSPTAIAIAKKIVLDGIKVVITNENLEKPDIKDVVYYPISADSEFFDEIISAYKFEAVIFLATREENLGDANPTNPGRVLDRLINTLKLSKSGNIKHLFYISSTEIYGEKPNQAEDTPPLPNTPNGFIIEAGEHQCKYYTDYFGVETTIIRVPFVYGDEDKRSLLNRTLANSKSSKEVVIPGSEDSLCAFLHIDDLTNFIKRMLDDIDQLESATYNLSPAESFTNGQFSEMLKVSFPGVSYQFDSSLPHATQPANPQKASKLRNWTSVHEIKNDLLTLIEKANAAPVPPKAPLLKLPKSSTLLYNALKWVELVLGASLTQFLVDYTGTPVQFKYIDFRLLFVILMGITHGTNFGLLAAILASASVIISFYRNDVEWTVIFYTVEYWLPFGLYLAAGVITGYLHDRKDNQIKFESENNKLIHEKYTFLYNVYEEIRHLKDQFRDQVVGYRDSFGRIYNITRELDTLQEEEVLFKAINVLETVMQNNKIAIYSIAPTNKFYARLELSSPGLVGKISKSLKLSDFPSLSEKINQSDVFQNTELQADYPDYFAPIKNGDTMVAAIAIWQASFDQKSLYYYNLFKVICGLIESSIVRATLFENTNSERIFVPGTRILLPEAFKNVLKTKASMKSNRNADFRLVKVKGIDGKDQFNWPDLYTVLSTRIRSMDIVGLLDDQNCYIVLSQVDQTYIDEILLRLKKSGITCNLVNEKDLSYV
jgi:nucleoside-diphosphate-sugar epimerase